MRRQVIFITRGLIGIVIAALLSTYFSGCDRTVRITIEDKESGEMTVYAIERIVSDQVFKPSPEQIAESLWVMPFAVGNKVVDLTIDDDTIFILKSYGGVQGIQIKFKDGHYDRITLGEMMTPEPAQAFYLHEWGVSVLCGNTWHRASISWPRVPPRHTPTWYETDQVPHDYNRVISLGDGKFLYELKDGRILISRDPKIYEEFPHQGIISDAIVVGGDRLIYIARDKGVFLYYPLDAPGDRKNIKISETQVGNCLSYDNGKLLIGDSTGQISMLQPPDSWAEDRLWDEITATDFDDAIGKIHPFQYGPQRVYLISLLDASCQVIGFDEENKLLPVGILAEGSYPTMVKPVTYDKFIDFGSKSVLCKGVDRTIRTIRLKMFTRVYPFINTPEGANHFDTIIRPEIISTEHTPTLSSEPLNIFDPGFEIDELDIVDGKLICRGISGIGIYNIEAPESPQLEQTYSINKADKGTFLPGKPGAFAYGLESGILQIVDLFEPNGNMPYTVSAIDLPGRFSFHYAFEANYVLFVFTDRGHAAVYDVVDLEDPVYLGYIDESIINFKEEGDRVYSENGLFYTLGRDFFEINPLAEGGPNIVRAFRNSGYSSNSLIMTSGYLWNTSSSIYGWVRMITDVGWEQVEAKVPSVRSVHGIKQLGDGLMMASHFDEAVVHNYNGLPEVKPVLRISSNAVIRDVLIHDQHVFCALGNEGVAVYSYPGT